MTKCGIVGTLFVGALVSLTSSLHGAQPATVPPTSPPAVKPVDPKPTTAPDAKQDTTKPLEKPANVSVPELSPFPPPPPPPPGAVAATVNGQDVPEMSVYRAILRSDRVNVPELRKEVLAILIDNVLVDQYLQALNVKVDKKEVDDSLEQLKKEAAELKHDYAKLLDSFKMTEDELRFHLFATLRWDKFVTQQSTDKALNDFFDKNKNMFDGSQVQIRHILLADRDESKAALAAIKKQIETEAAQEFAKLPAQTDNLAKEKERIKLLETAFAKAAVKESVCDSKKAGGDIGWIPRLGKTVEPFARAAFALKPHEISEPVHTEFGYHLILIVDAQAGKDVKFQDLRPIVGRVFASRLREAVLTQMRPNSKIAINPPPKSN
jgi:peptidyl-prolyl cis-trans isomerase C